MVTNMKVKKKSGNLEDFNVEKIKQAISFACDNLKVSPLALESLFNQSLFEGITTVSIQENLIHHAKTLCSPQEPDWVFVAGRLETMNLWSRTGSYKLSFSDFVKQQVSANLWKHPAFGQYSEEELVELGEYLVKDRDLSHSYASVVTAQQKYLMRNECIQQMIMGNSMIIASVEEESVKMQICKEAYDFLSLREVSSATPWLGNLRANGNISSCFIIQPEDNLISIYDNLKNSALISQAGGGLGVSLGRLRARGSDLMGVEGISGGILGWTKLFNDTAVYVNQCFAPESLVLTENGDVEIGSLKEGDKVLTHDGSYKAVEYIYEADAEKLDMFEIDVGLGPVTVSGSHPVMVKTANDIYKWVSIRDLSVDDEIINA